MTPTDVPQPHVSLTPCRASSWVSAAAGNFWVFWTGSGPTSLLDMCTAWGGGPLGQPCFFPALLPCQSLLQPHESNHLLRASNSQRHQHNQCKRRHSNTGCHHNHVTSAHDVCLLLCCCCCCCCWGWVLDTALEVVNEGRHTTKVSLAGACKRGSMQSKAEKKRGCPKGPPPDAVHMPSKLVDPEPVQNMSMQAQVAAGPMKHAGRLHEWHGACRPT